MNIRLRLPKVKDLHWIDLGIRPVRETLHCKTWLARYNGHRYKVVLKNHSCAPRTTVQALLGHHLDGKSIDHEGEITELV